jgi:glycosyltransferase involved in cell wall biosynthesis
VELIEKLCLLISNYPRFQLKRQNLSKAMAHFAWENLIDQYDNELEKLSRFKAL